MVSGLDFGQRVRGRVLDAEWRPTRPKRLVAGVVVTLYPQAPRVVGLQLADGELVDVRVGP